LSPSPSAPPPLLLLTPPHTHIPQILSPKKEMRKINAQKSLVEQFLIARSARVFTFFLYVFFAVNEKLM